MNTTRTMKTWSIALGTVAALAITAIPAGPAHADRALDQQPAVRNRLLLVAKRLEATPLFEATINADFRAIIGGGIKLEYHLGDMLSIGAIGVFSASIDTKLTERVLETLETDNNDMTNPTLMQLTIYGFVLGVSVGDLFDPIFNWRWCVDFELGECTDALETMS